MDGELERIKKHYQVCNDCNTKAGGVYPDGYTYATRIGQCENCGKKYVILIPWVDYNWPVRKDDIVAKTNRD